MSNFKKDVRRGKLGESAAEIIFSWGDWKNVKRYDDVSALQKYQEQEIDFICYVEENGKKLITPVEVKTDYRAASTGNLFIEHAVKYYGGDWDGIKKLSWLHTTKSEYMFFYVPEQFSENGTMYIITTRELRNYIEQNKHNLRYVTTEEDSKDGYKATSGYLVPIKKLCSKCDVQKIKCY